MHRYPSGGVSMLLAWLMIFAVLLTILVSVAMTHRN